MYTPAAGDIGSTLRAQAMYDDEEGEDKTARGESFRSVRSAPQSNTVPVFPDQDPGAIGVQTGQSREVAENTPAGTNLGAPVAANDPGDILTYALSGSGAASFDIVRSSGQLRTKVALDFETTPTYTITVTATDPFGSPATSLVTITVTDVNEAPMVTGAATIDHVEGTTALQDDSGTTEVEGRYAATDADTTADPVASLKWSLSGADASKLDISITTPRTLFFNDAPDYESPGDSNSDNVYEVTVVVRDSAGNTDEQAVTVKVTNMEEAGAVELSTLQPRIAFPITATLTDADNITAGSVSWQWYKGNVTQQDLANLDETECVDATSSNCFIKGATSATYTPVAIDVQDTLVAVALYTDGSPNDPADVKDFAMMVTAQPALADTRNKAPVFPDQDAEMEGDQTTRMVQENAPMIGVIDAIEGMRAVGDPVTATDSILDQTTGNPTDEVLTYSLGGPDAASFTIDRSSAQISTKADVPLDKETRDMYTVTVTATDPSGLTATITVTITVDNVDEAPEIMLGGLGISGMRSVRYAENGTDAVATYTAVGPESASTTWSLSGDDAGDFNITAGGELRFNASPNYEAPRDADTNNEYKVTVQADDGTYMDTLNVTVTVTDVDEGPTKISAGPSDTDYAENDTRVVATYMVTGSNAALVTWSLEGADGGDFTIIDGVLRFSNSPDYEMPADADTDNIYRVTVKATAGTDMDTLDVTVTVTDVDEVLTSISGPSNTDYAENRTDDVATFTAMDPEGETISWTLEGTDADLFDISSDGGVLSFKSSPDYELPADANTDNIYMITVKASDGTDMDSLDVTVTVTDVDEALTSISGPSNTDYAENGTDDVATFTAMDPEGATISWTLEGTDAGVFDISSGGVLTFKISPDYEMPADADTDNIYMVTVEASDGTNMATTLAVTITVTDVEEMAPEMSLLDRYDADGNDQIDVDELREAITHYILGDLDVDDVREIIRLYILG